MVSKVCAYVRGFIGKVGAKIEEHVVTAVSLSVITPLGVMAVIFRKKLVALLQHEYTVTVWLVCLTLVVMAGVFFALGRFTVTRRKARTSKWRRYTHDKFLGVDWHWTYSGDCIKAYRVYCPKCKVSISSTHLGATDRMFLRCELCKTVTRLPSAIGHMHGDLTVHQWLEETVAIQIRKRKLGPPGFDFRF